MREEAAMATEAARSQAAEEDKRRIRELNAPHSAQGLKSDLKQVEITSLDLTLMMQFPTGGDLSIAESVESLRAALSSRYGPLENIDLLPQAGSSSKPDEAKSKKQKKPKGPRWAVEFKQSNLDGCWACWKDHLEAETNGTRPLVTGLKVKFAGRKDGEAPDWVTNLPDKPSQGDVEGLNKHAIETKTPSTSSRISNAFAASFASTFPSIPSSFPTPEDQRKRREAERERKAVDDFESGVLFRMRQQERNKLEEEILRKEAEEV
jgi:DnaJ family protein C protein 17